MYEQVVRQLLLQVIPTFDMAINEVFFERFPDTILEHQIQVRPFNADKTRNMRALNPEGGYQFPDFVMAALFVTLIIVWFRVQQQSISEVRD